MMKTTIPNEDWFNNFQEQSKLLTDVVNSQVGYAINREKKI